MKVLHIITGLGVGGAEQQLRLLRFISTWFGPVLMGLIGFSVWASRRERS